MNKNSLFITGATGFIGRTLIKKIPFDRFERVFCLTRGGVAPAELHGVDRVQLVTGSICEPDSYAQYLDSCGTVVHLAAVTGKTSPEEYFTVNARGTEVLVEECQQRQVRNFLYVSTIAVKFSDKTRYFYAQSKELGEKAVRNSSLRYSIVRPTVVLGEGAAIWKSLSACARRRILVMPGDGTTRLQPIYVGDLADCLITILNEGLFSRETLELGGPEAISFEHLLRKIHHTYYQKEPTVLHLPFKPLIALLSFIEKRSYSTLPISVGQLAAFANDGTIEINELYSLSAPGMKSIGEMIRQVASHE